jgi:hypothetical protein
MSDETAWRQILEEHYNALLKMADTFDNRDDAIKWFNEHFDAPLQKYKQYYYDIKLYALEQFEELVAANINKKVVKKEDKEENEYEKAAEIFIATYGTIPTKKPGLFVPHGLLPNLKTPISNFYGALRAANLNISHEKALKQSTVMEYQYNYGIIIRRAPKTLIITKGKSDWEKEMDRLMGAMDEDIKKVFN